MPQQTLWHIAFSAAATYHNRKVQQKAGAAVDTDTTHSNQVQDLEQTLAAAFAEAKRRYQERGFQRRVGFGKKPAIINVDLANAWTRPGNPFTCEHMDDLVMPSVQRLIEAGRQNNHLVVYVTTCYQNTDRDDPFTDMGLWHTKIPVEAVPQSSPELWAIDDRIAPQPNDPLVVKKTCKRFSWYLPCWLPKSRGYRHNSGHRGHGMRLCAPDCL